MNNLIFQELKRYQLNNVDDYKNAIKEILQNIVLIGLAKGGFFKKGSFYGGTCLRIFANLDRFSEDLDFTLNKADTTFNFSPYFASIKEIAKEYGFIVELLDKKKEETMHINISSSFLKVNTKDALSNCGAPSSFLAHIQKEEKLQIKIEADIEPPLGFKIETRKIGFANKYDINVLDMSSLLAGKLHAILYRQYAHRVKGRDYYDFIQLVNKNIPVNIDYLKSKIIKSDNRFDSKSFNLNKLKVLLKSKIDSININQANEDLEPFINSLSAEPILTREILNTCINNLK